MERMKFAVFTSTRAEYGLLYPLIQRIRLEDQMDVDLIVSGAHLLQAYGKTIEFIRKDQIPVKYEMPIMEETFSGTEREVADSMARGISQAASIFDKETYSALIVLGDRYELLCVCIPAMMYRIPIVHIHGGETTEGALDEKIRHAITKMASVHFPSVKEYANRIIQMGENPDYVFVVGALGIDNICHLRLLSKSEWMTELEIPQGRKVSAVTYHPVTTLSREQAVKEIREVMDALTELPYYSIVTMPNSDAGGKEIFAVITDYAERFPDKIVIKKSLGQVRYLSLLKYADVMIGNSSSGILESASFHLPTVNIGDRQRGRLQPANVVNCICQKEEILQAVNRAQADDFREKLKGYENPYGDGRTSERMIQILKEIRWSDPELIQKHFFDGM